MVYAKKSFRLSPPQILVSGFAVVILLGALLLMLPAATRGTPLSFINALFTATSAACVTGLVVVDTGTKFTLFGQIVILLLVQIGGLGFTTMATLFALVLRKRISLRERLVLQEALNQISMEGIVRLIRKVILYTFIIESAAAALLAARWSMDMPFARAVYFGVFHSVSFFNNAGFDLMGNYRSMASYADDVIVNAVAIVLIVLGGLGFIVLADVMEYRRRRRLSLHSKVVLTASFLLIAAGAVVIYLLEFSNPATLAPLNHAGKALAAFLQSVTPRSGGVTTVDMAGMRQATQFFIIILMFIGASPGSTGGGIKTTTFAILTGAMIAMIRGRQNIVLFRYRLGQELIFKAITMTLLALFLIIFTTMVLSMTEPYPFLTILFEVTSAFGTVGLSMGLTPHLTLFGKFIIILMMFIGRLGPLTLAYALGTKSEKELYRHPEGKITIG
jgi:trk system potassium uptake protein TrkH